MVLGDMLERFILDAPMPVLFRLLMERALDPEELDRMFESTATRQYTRELLFSSIVDLMAVVVCRFKPSVRRAYLDSSGIAATLTAVYEKLKGTEPAVCRALVRTTAAPRRGGGATRTRPPRLSSGLPRQGLRLQSPGGYSAPHPRDPRCRGSRAPRPDLGGLRPRPRLGHRRRALRGRPRSGAYAARGDAR